MSDDKHKGHDHAPGEGHDDAHAHGVIFGFNIELVFAVASGLCVGVGWLLEAFAPVHWGVPLTLFLAAYIFGGYFTVQEAVGKIRQRQFEIDFLMLVARPGRRRSASSSRAACCCSCSASATRWRTTRWAERGGQSSRWPNSPRDRPRAARRSRD